MTREEVEQRNERNRREQARILTIKLEQAHNRRVWECLQWWAENRPEAK